MAYGPDIRAQAYRLIVWDGYTPALASEHLGGAPAPSTIDHWARAETNEKGETWYEERDRLAEERYRVSAPDQVAAKITRKIQQVLDQPGFDPAQADMLAKLSKHLRQFVEPKYHVSMTFQVLTRFTQHLQEHHPDLLTREFARAARDFKEEERSRIEG